MMQIATKLLLAALLSCFLCILLNAPVADAVKGNSKRLSKPFEIVSQRRQQRILQTDGGTTEDLLRKHSKKCEDLEAADLRDHKYDDLDCSPTATPSGSEEDTPAPVAPVAPTPAPVTPTYTPTTTTPAPSSDSTTTGQPTTTTTTSEACVASAEGSVYETDRSINVKYLYELVTYNDSDMDQVALAVDKAVRRFLLDSLIDCNEDRRRRLRQLTALGVGPGDTDRIGDGSCANIAPLDPTTQVCYNMEGAIDLFLDDASTWTDEEGAFIVYQLLENAYNTPNRPLQQGRFVDPNLGILDLYFVRGLNGGDSSSNGDGGGDLSPPTDFGETFRTSSGDGGMSKVTKALVVCGSILVVLAGMVLVAHKRHKASDREVKEIEEYPTNDDDTAGTADLRATSSDDLEGGGSNKHRSCLPAGLAASADQDDYEYETDFYRTQSNSEQILRDLGSMALTEEMMQDNHLDPIFISPRGSEASSVMTPSQFPERNYVISNTVAL